jgi:hypothetical protein
MWASFDEHTRAAFGGVTYKVSLLLLLSWWPEYVNEWVGLLACSPL